MSHYKKKNKIKRLYVSELRLIIIVYCYDFFYIPFSSKANLLAEDVLSKPAKNLAFMIKTIVCLVRYFCKKRYYGALRKEDIAPRHNFKPEGISSGTFALKRKRSSLNVRSVIGLRVIIHVAETPHRHLIRVALMTLGKLGQRIKLQKDYHKFFW